MTDLSSLNETEESLTESPVKPAARPQSRAALLAIVGSFLAAIGPVLDWWTVSGSMIAAGEVTQTGLNWGSGVGTFLFAIITGIFGVLMWFNAPTNGGRGLAIATSLLALIVLGFAGYSAFAPEHAVQTFEAANIADRAGISDSLAQAQIEAGIDNGLLHVEAELGTYIAALGGFIVVAGALLGMVPRRRN